MRRLAIVVALFAATLVSAQSRRPFTFEDMMALKRVGGPVPSPNGKWVLFAAVDVSLEANTRIPHIWAVPVAGGDAKQITAGPRGEDRPRWSPDGKRFSFTSARDGSSQIWVYDFDDAAGTVSGEPRKVTSISTEAGGNLWSPDGKHILFTSEVWPECNGKPDEDACNKEKDEARAKSKVKALIFTRLLYRHWNHYNEGKRSHLFAQPVNPDGSPAGVARDLTPGDYETPPFSLGGPDDYAVSPDGKEVAYTSNHDPVEAISTNNDIWLVPIAGGAAKKISSSPGSDSSPQYSPDGKFIAWRMQERAGYESDRFRLVKYDRASGAITNLTPDFDAWVNGFTWSPDSKNFFFVAEDKGEQPIYILSAGGGKPGELARGHNDDVAVAADGRTLLFTRMSVQAPNEIYRAKLVTVSGPSSTLTAEPLTHLNDAVLSQVAMQPLEPFWFTGSEKARVQGFIVKPPNFDPARKYPVKFLIHGGPQGAWGDSWSFRWNPELMAASGYVVVMVNPRGSTGYGQKFIDDINGDWGGRVYQDLMLGLDYAENTYSYIARDRECALGASYGGYMINWIGGRNTRFRCLVSHDGMFNTVSAYGATEELWFNEWEFKGAPWTNPAMYEKWSPNRAAPNFKTPTLVVHGQLDYRLDVSEGFQFYTCLQRLNVPSKMLYFPDEGHWVLKPQNSRLWYKTVGDWVDQWTK